MFSESFKNAVCFTLDRNLNLDTERHSLNKSYQLEDISRLTLEIGAGLQEQFSYYERQDYDPIVRFGGDCGNVHLLVLNFIQKNFPDLPANLTIGEVRFDTETRFSFSEEKFLGWRENRPRLLDCHVWITVGNSAIVDATIGTYINNRILKSTKLGGIFYGRPGQLTWNPIVRADNQMPGTSSLEYLPVVLGREAFLSIVPKA